MHAYSSFAQLPLAGAAVSITATDGTGIAMRVTDRSGAIIPVELPVPDRAESQTPESGERPFAAVNIHVRLRGYEQITVENVQVFAGTTTVQDLNLIPLSELPGAWDQSELFNTPPQNL